MSTLGVSICYVHYTVWQPKRLNKQRDGPARRLPALAGADLIFQWIGMVEYIPCYSGPAEHWGLLLYLPLGQPAGKYLLSKISKSGQGQHSVYSVVATMLFLHVSFMAEIRGHKYVQSRYSLTPKLHLRWNSQMSCRKSLLEFSFRLFSRNLEYLLMKDFVFLQFAMRF